MPQIKITIDIDDEVGDVQISIDEITADGITVTRSKSGPTTPSP